MPWADDAAGARRLEAIEPAFSQFFADDDATEARVNPQDGRLWLDTWTRGLIYTDTVVPAPRLERFLNVVATAHGATLGGASPVLAAQLPTAAPFHGARLQAFVPPVAPGVAVIIRKRPSHTPSLDDYAATGRLTRAQRDALREAVTERWTTVVSGATGSGKTTFGGAVLGEVYACCPEDRLVILEDTPELKCPTPDHLALCTTPELPFSALVKHALRSSPTRIVLGEVRDAAALDFLDASATGHPGGLCTTHAGSVHETLYRLDRLAQRANVPSQLPLVGDAVQLVVVLGAGRRKRQVIDLARVSGFTPGAGFSLHRLTECGRWTAA